MSTTITADSSTTGRGAFIRARLASVLAIAPLGVWTMFHLWNNLSAIQGDKPWSAAVTGGGSTAMWLTSVVVLLPLLLHTIWGISRLFTARPNGVRYGFFANFKYLLQRLSAVGVLFFLGAHIWLAFLHPRFVEGHVETFADLSSEMRYNTPTLIVYLLGTLGVAYHLANGVATFAMGWGLAGSRRSVRAFERGSMVLFALLLAMSWGAIYGLWSAGGLAVAG